MKNNTNNVFKLGMFVTIGLLLLVAAVYVIGAQKNLFNPTFRVKTIFRNVSGTRRFDPFQDSAHAALLFGAAIPHQHRNNSFA